MMEQIDVNVDIGEIEGDDGRRTDAELLRFVSTANISCGVHAGDDEIMRRTIVAAKHAGVTIAAHPGYDDREHMGRRNLELDDQTVEQLVASQVFSMQQACSELGATLSGVKPHGALYHQAASSSKTAAAICRGIESVNKSLFVVGLAGSGFLDVARGTGMLTVAEAFADRRYASDGSLVPRSEPHALITDPDEAIAQVELLCRDGCVLADNGRTIPVGAQSICIHSDSPYAVQIATRLHHWMLDQGIRMAPPSRR